MNRWYQLTRMRGAVYLILIGVLALLNQWRILSWDKSWPLFLIVPGLLALADRAAWAAHARDQQAAQQSAAFTGPGTGTIPAGGISSWPGAPSSSVSETSFIQPHPPAPGGSDREDR